MIPKRTLIFQCAGGFLLSVILSLPTIANAIDAKGNFISRGVGALKDGSCGKYVREGDIDTRGVYAHWLMGYISGINKEKRGKPDYSNGADAEGLIQWIENYCKENPLSSFSSAADAMLDELNKKK